MEVSVSFYSHRSFGQTWINWADSKLRVQINYKNKNKFKIKLVNRFKRIYSAFDASKNKVIVIFFAPSGKTLHDISFINGHHFVLIFISIVSENFNVLISKKHAYFKDKCLVFIYIVLAFHTISTKHASYKIFVLRLKKKRSFFWLISNKGFSFSLHLPTKARK